MSSVENLLSSWKDSVVKLGRQLEIILLKISFGADGGRAMVLANMANAV